MIKSFGHSSSLLPFLFRVVGEEEQIIVNGLAGDVEPEQFESITGTHSLSNLESIQSNLLTRSVCLGGNWNTWKNTYTQRENMKTP